MLNLIVVHICVLYLKPKANFFMEMPLSNKPNNAAVTFLSSAENVLFNSRIQVMTGQPFYLGRGNATILCKK